MTPDPEDTARLVEDLLSNQVPATVLISSRHVGEAFVEALEAEESTIETDRFSLPDDKETEDVDA